MAKSLFEIRLAEDKENMWICTAIKPAYAYENDKRTDTVVGYTYRCLHAQALAYGLIDIKVTGKPALVDPDAVPDGGFKVTFDGLTFSQWTDRRTGARRTSGRAEDAVKA